MNASYGSDAAAAYSRGLPTGGAVVIGGVSRRLVNLTKNFSTVWTIKHVTSVI